MGMNAIRPWLIIGMFAALVACTSKGSLHTPAFDEPLSEAIATAKTPEDHEALARHYEQEADALQARSEQHLAMAGSYKRLRQARRPLNPQKAAKHCRRLAENYRASAEENRALAKLHRKIAQELAP